MSYIRVIANLQFIILQLLIFFYLFLIGYVADRRMFGVHDLVPPLFEAMTTKIKEY